MILKIFNLNNWQPLMFFLINYLKNSKLSQNLH